MNLDKATDSIVTQIRELNDKIEKLEEENKRLRDLIHKERNKWQKWVSDKEMEIYKLLEENKKLKGDIELATKAIYEFENKAEGEK